MSTLKPILLEISERLVDLTDAVRGPEDAVTDARRHEIRMELRSIGDRLVGFLDHATGDDRTFLMFMLGSLSAALDLWDKADYAFAEARKDWPDHVGLLNEHYYTLIQLSRYPEALDTVEASIRIGGETPDLLQAKAIALAYMNRLAEAKAVMFTCIAKYPNDASSHETLAEIDQLTASD